MKTKYYYIHGLHGTKNGTKFLELQKQYPEIECLEWFVMDDMDYKLEQWSKSIFVSSQIYDNICIISSSTGSNFAQQLRLMQPGIFMHQVLINPLLDFETIKDKSIMPNNIKQYLIQITKFSASLILLGGLDTVVDNTNYLINNDYIKNNNQIIIDEQSTHSFERLNLYYSEINDLINSIYL